MTLALGIGLIVVAIAWLLYKTFLAFNSEGGTDLMLVVYDAAVYPPLLAAVGVYLVAQYRQLSWPWWSYLVLWLVLTAAAAGMICLCEEIGDRKSH